MMLENIRLSRSDSSLPARIDGPTPAVTIEADSLSPAEMAPTMLQFFDSLSPGESFVFVSSESPAWLLAVLRAGRRGEFDWTPLESGAETFRVEISRRAADRGALRRVSEALESDHDRLARLEVGAFVAGASGDAPTAERWYAAFSSGLKRHIAIEEELLFPLFEKRAGVASDAESTTAMRREHQEILRLLGKILRTIGDPAKLPDKDRAAFHELLEEHHLKEQEILYPGLDFALAPDEADALVARIQGFAG
jgi:uncharacterized protein (DUF2249 family)